MDAYSLRLPKCHGVSVYACMSQVGISEAEAATGRLG